MFAMIWAQFVPQMSCVRWLLPLWYCYEMVGRLRAVPNRKPPWDVLYCKKRKDSVV